MLSNWKKRYRKVVSNINFVYLSWPIEKVKNFFLHKLLLRNGYLQPVSFFVSILGYSSLWSGFVIFQKLEINRINLNKIMSTCIINVSKNKYKNTGFTLCLIKFIYFISQSFDILLNIYFHCLYHRDWHYIRPVTS